MALSSIYITGILNSVNEENLERASPSKTIDSYYKRLKLKSNNIFILSPHNNYSLYNNMK